MIRLGSKASVCPTREGGRGKCSEAGIRTEVIISFSLPDTQAISSIGVKGKEEDGQGKRSHRRPAQSVTIER